MKDNKNNESDKSLKSVTSGAPDNGHKKSQDTFVKEDLAFNNDIVDDYIPFPADGQGVPAPGDNQAANVLEFANRNEMIHAEILKGMPKPGHGPCSLPVFDPCRRGEAARLNFKLTRDWRVKEGRSDRWIEVRAEKDGRKTDWIRLGDSQRYKEAGYSVPDRPKIIGIDWLRATGWGDSVFITENPMDYWAINNALSYDRVTEKGGVELAGDEALGCAVMPWRYDFSERDVNGAFRGKKIVVMDYGNSERATEWAERLSVQDVAESVSVCRLDPAFADKGVFLHYELNQAQKTPQWLGPALDAIWEYLGSGVFKEALEPVETKEEPTLLEDSVSTVREQEFLIYPYLPKGEVTVIAGAGGTGKSTVVMDWVARLIKGENELVYSHYEQDHIGPQTVLWFSKEEGKDTMISPRALQLGLFGTYRFHAPSRKDCNKHAFRDPWYQETVEKTGADLVVFDSLQAFLGGDTNNGADVVTAMNYFENLADECGVTVLLIHHFNKKVDYSSFLEAISGRHEIGDFVRSMCVLVEDPEFENTRTVKQLVLYQKKSSFHRGIDDIPNLVYRMEAEDKRNAIVKAHLVGANPWSEDVLLAKLENYRKKKRESAVSDDEGRSNLAQSLEEIALDLLNSDGYVSVPDFRANPKFGGSEHVREDALKRLQTKEGLARKSYSNTVYSRLSAYRGYGPNEKSQVLVRPCDVANTPEGLARIVNDYFQDGPVTESDIKALGVAKTAKTIKAAVKILTADYPWVNSDGDLFRIDNSPEVALAEKIKELGKRVTLEEATEMAGGDEKAASEALEILKDGGWPSDRDGRAVTPPPGLTRRGNNVGQELISDDMKAPLY